MYILVTFENLDSEETKNTLLHLHGSPNGTFLAHPCLSRIMYDRFGQKYRTWWIDINVLNRCYGGILNAFNMIIKNFPGVERIDILPFEEDVKDMTDEEYTSFGIKVCNYITSMSDGTL
jgi:hypothetical protein